MLDSSSDGVIGLVLPDLPRGGEPSRLEELAMRICEGNVKEKVAGMSEGLIADRGHHYGRKELLIKKW
jgi:hypothetical protein